MRGYGVNVEPLVPDEAVSRPRLLIVDDDKDAADALDEVLARRGYEVRSAYDASDALDAVAAFGPEIALVDFRLGRENGIDLIGQFKLKRPQLPCIVMTAYADLDVAIGAVRHGAYDFLQKPIGLDRLEAALGRAYELVRLKREKEQAKHQLEQSEQDYRALFENAAAGIGRSRITDGKILLANRKLARMFGYERVARFVAEFSFADHYTVPGERERLIALYKEGSDKTVEVSLTTRDGSAVIVANQGWVDEKAGHIDFVMTDITNLKKGEEENRRLAEAIDGLSENFALYGPDDRLVICNQGYRKLNEAIPEATRPGVLYEEHMRAVIAKGLAPKAMGREEDYIRERMELHINPMEPYEVVRKDRVWLVHEQRVADDSTAIIATDITERKQAEENLRLALVQAEEANQAKSQFLATMSHELRTPLNAILGFADIISHQYLGPIGMAKYAEYADDIQVSGQHLLTLVNEILDLSTIEAGKHSLAKESLAVGEIVRDCFQAIKKTAADNGVELLKKVTKDLPPLHADRRAVKQILLNLLSNAVKFTPDGGQITLRARAANEHHTIEVSDTGRGIPAEKMATLTDRFVRGETDPHMAQAGTGLGLAIVKELVDLHAGELVINSEVGVGTTITVTLPSGAP